MKARVEPDITTEVCAACGGTWLDRGEFNALITSLGGDIELPAQHAAQTSEAPDGERSCPRCEDTKLHVAWLNTLALIQIDVCAKCRGMYLDPGEVALTNASLLTRQRKGSRRPSEVREWVDGRLIRLEREQASRWGGDGFAYVLLVYFREPLPFDVHVTPASWLDRLVGLVHRSAERVETGAEDFDRLLRVRSVEPAAARDLFTASVRSAIIGLLDDELELTFLGGTIEIGSKGVAYREGAHANDKEGFKSERKARNAVEHQIDHLFSQGQLDWVTQRLVDVADIIEAEAAALRPASPRE